MTGNGRHVVVECKRNGGVGEVECDVVRVCILEMALNRNKNEYPYGSIMYME